MLRQLFSAGMKCKVIILKWGINCDFSQVRINQGEQGVKVRNSVLLRT